MSKVCEICNKGYQKGNLVPRGIGKRVTRRTIVKRLPNLFTKRVSINGITHKLKICTSCIKRMKFEAKAQEVSAEA